MTFICDESCGKCSPCRIGTKRCLELLDKITEGKGTMHDLDELKSLAEVIKANSLCGLGQTATNPVLSTMASFKDEYLAHVRDKKCPAGTCPKLYTLTITDACIGCTKCVRECPADAIYMDENLPVVDLELCTQCGHCVTICPRHIIADFFK